MRQQRLFCIATLVLMVATLVVVAADDFILPGVQHEPSTCPICDIAQCLGTAQILPLVIWSEPLAVRWLPPDAVHIFWNHPLSCLFCARAPPLLVH